MALLMRDAWKLFGGLGAVEGNPSGFFYSNGPCPAGFVLGNAGTRSGCWPDNVSQPLERRPIGVIADRPVAVSSGGSSYDLQRRQVELAQIQAERQAVEAELADLKARAADRTAAQRSARSRGTVLPPAAATPAQSRMLEAPGAAVPGQDVGEDLMDRVGPPVSAQPSVLEQIQSAPPIALAVAGLAAVFVIRAIMKKGR